MDGNSDKLWIRYNYFIWNLLQLGLANHKRIQTVRIGDNNNDSPFIKSLLGTILAAYRDFEGRVNIVGKKMSAREMVKKAVNSKIGKFTKNDIAELCPEISKGSVEQTLKKLCDEGKIKKEGVGKATFYHIV